MSGAFGSPGNTDANNTRLIPKWLATASVATVASPLRTGASHLVCRVLILP